jgi:hypothetical protein
MKTICLLITTIVLNVALDWQVETQQMKPQQTTTASSVEYLNRLSTNSSIELR